MKRLLTILLFSVLISINVFASKFMSKAFSAYSIETLESRVDDFISDSSYEIINISLSTTADFRGNERFYAIVLYKNKERK